MQRDLAITPVERMKPGFADAVHDAQSTFSSIMQAMARPGSIQSVSHLSATPDFMLKTTGAVLLTLADYDSPLWFDDPMLGDADVVNWTRFHTGAPLTKGRSNAAFAVVSQLQDGLEFSDFHQGDPEYPDRSTTLIVQVDRLSNQKGWQLTGPGIKESQQLEAAPLSTAFLSQWEHNRGLFPLGIDVILCAPDAIACLPRTVKIEETGSCM